MENQEQTRRSFLAKLITGYRSLALLLLNTLVILLVLHIIVLFIIKINDLYISKNVVAKKYKNFNSDVLYPDLTKTEVDRMLKETWSRTYLYEPFTQFKERPSRGQYVNVDNNGFRYTKNQGPWPPRPENINIFLFGGSTTFGYGVPDDQTIASYLQEYLTAKLGKDVRVYNFGRGFYYLSQERLLYEKLLKSGFVPDLAIFIDGINELAFNNDEPVFTDRLRDLFSTSTVEMSIRLISKTTLGQVAGLLQNKIASLLSKKDHQPSANPLEDPENSKSGATPKTDRVIQRYLFDKKLVEAASQMFGVKPIFIWQPSPFYNYDRTYYAFSNGAGKEEIGTGYGYSRMADFIRENPMGDDFIWCADIQKDLKKPLYVDQCHYTAAMSKLFAETIADHLLKNQKLTK